MLKALSYLDDVASVCRRIENWANFMLAYVE